jgi:O-antigen/teichoic acid export membrane protein
LLPYVALLSLLALLFSTFNATLGGLGRMDLTSYNEALAQILVVASSGTLLYFRFDLHGMVIGAFCGYTVAQVTSFIHVQNSMPIRLIARTRISRHKARQLLGTGGWILANGVCTSMLLPLTRLMLSRYAGLEAVAVTDMCLTGSLRVRNIFDAAFRPMMPEVSGARARDKSGFHGRVRSIDRKAFLVIFAVALPTFIGLMIVMNPLLHLWLHKSFNPLLPNTFRIALIGAFISLLGSSAYYMLIGIGNARDAAYAAGIQLLANAAVLMAIAFSRQHITVGEAAAAFAIATACATLYLRIRIHLVIHSRNVPSDPIEVIQSEVNL